MLNVVKLKDISIWEMEGEKKDSWIWNVLIDLNDKIRPPVIHKPGDGKSTSLWYDRWGDNEPLCNIIPKIYRNAARMENNFCVADMIHNGRWQWPNDWNQLFPELLNVAVPILQERVADKVTMVFCLSLVLKLLGRI